MNVSPCHTKSMLIRILQIATSPLSPLRNTSAVALAGPTGYYTLPLASSVYQWLGQWWARLNHVCSSLWRTGCQWSRARLPWGSLPLLAELAGSLQNPTRRNLRKCSSCIASCAQSFMCDAMSNTWSAWAPMTPGDIHYLGNTEREWHQDAV